jgi:competence protein ComEA
MQATARFATAIVLGLVSAGASALDIQQATEAELDSLRGLGPSLTAKVLAARAEKPFDSWADLMQRVNGIREAMAQRLSDQGLTVQGLAYKSAHKPAHKAP